MFDATCMQEVRENLLAIIDQPATNLTRPLNNNTRPGAAGSAAWDIDYLDAMGDSLTFLRAQWAGVLPADYNTVGPGNEWRKPGFVEKAAGCPADLGGNFATGGAFLLSTEQSTFCSVQLCVATKTLCLNLVMSGLPWPPCKVHE